MMIRFRARPREIEAIRFDGSEESAKAIVAWAGLKTDAVVPLPGQNAERYIAIPTYCGHVSILPGMWVVRDQDGRYDRYLDKRMHELWEEVPETGRAIQEAVHAVLHDPAKAKKRLPSGGRYIGLDRPKEDA